MQTQIQFIVPVKIPIPRYVKIGALIGCKGRNLKPIADRTGTYIHVNVNTAQIEIKINQKSNATPVDNRINEAKNQLNDLIKELEKERNRKKVPLKKKENNVGFLRNNDNRHETLRDTELRKERRYSKREMNEQTDSVQQVNRYFKNK